LRYGRTNSVPATSQSPVGFLTVIARNYLVQARVLMASVAEHHPGSPRLAVLADEGEDCFDTAQEPFQVIRSTELDLPDSAWFHFRYNKLELTTAVKPFAMRRALELLGVESVIYLDADIRLFAPLDPVTAALGEASIVLTPHLLRRVDSDGLAVERQLLRTGAYNLGFIAIRGDAVAESFLCWWRERLTEHCLVDLTAGLFVDQKWVDLVPGLFDGVRILRAPGLNVAWWNLPERPVTFESGGYRAAGEPLYFFHFSGFDPERPDSLSKHATADRAAALGQAKELLADYAQLLLSSGYVESKAWTPAYESYPDGSPIPAVVRKVLELEPGLKQTTDDPFSPAGREKVFEFWNRPVEAPGGSGFLTRLAYRIYQSEPQIQASMPDVFGAHREAYAAWFVSEGAARYGLPPELTAPLQDMHRDPGRALLPPLALTIYESRRDLQQEYPEPYGKDALGLLSWLLSYGEAECDLDAPSRRALQLEFERLVAQMRSPLQRWRCRARLALLSRSAGRQS
jgi:hypothetical protein